MECISEQNIFNTIKEDVKNKRYDKIAIKLGIKIQQICPFNTKEAYNEILIGSIGSEIKHKGYLGWRVFDQLPLKKTPTDELKKYINDPKIQKNVKILYNLSQKYLIIPMMKKMFRCDDMYNNEINRLLNLDKLDKCNRKGYITSELRQRLCNQNIMTENRKKGNKIYYKKTKNVMTYTPPEFTMPKISMSKGHQIVSKVLENKILKEYNNFSMTNEYRNLNKCGYKGYMRYDIAIFENNILFGFIEYDGKQHYEYVPHFHRNGISDFIKQQEKDKIKDDEAFRLTNKNCLRIKTLNKEEIYREIKLWLNNIN